MTKVILSCEFPGTAGVVLALAHPNLSQPFAVFPCWVLVLALAAGARGAVSQGALCDMSGSGRAGALQPPLAMAVQEHPLHGLQGAACPTKSEIPLVLLSDSGKLLPPAGTTGPALFSFSHFSP